jgi:hypothetical protein
MGSSIGRRRQRGDGGTIDGDLDAVVATSDACSFGIGIDYSSAETICTSGASVDDDAFTAFTASTCEITESTRVDGDGGRRREWRWQVSGNRATDVIAESGGIATATTFVDDGKVSSSWRR